MPEIRIPISRHKRKLAGLALLVAAVAVLFVVQRDELTLESLARREAQLRAYQAEHPWIVYSAAAVVYLGIASFALPGAAPLSLACGWLFGLWQALLLVSVASTAGATVAFLLSRYFLRDWVQSRFSGRLARLQVALQRDGALYLFMLRLTPAVPFFVVNVIMGLTPMRARTFWWVSQVGMLPATVIIVNAGAALPGLGQIAEQGLQGIFTPQLLVALLLLGLFPLLVKRLATWYR